MGIFGEEGQAEGYSLSDEFIYGEEEERQEDAAPLNNQDDTMDEEEEPADDNRPDDDDQISEDDSEEVEEKDPEEGQSGISAEDYERLREQLEQVQKSYREIQSWTSRTSNDNVSLRQENERMRLELERLKSGVVGQYQQQPNDEDSLKERVKKLITDPDSLIDARVQEALRPIREKEEQQRRDMEFMDSIKECSSAWIQLGSEEGKRDMLMKMQQLSDLDGDHEGWKKRPAEYMFRSCKSLWGIPRIVDQDAIEAARKAEREAYARELAEKQKRENRTIVQHPNQSLGEPEKLSPEEMILNEIIKSDSGGIFG